MARFSTVPRSPRLPFEDPAPAPLCPRCGEPLQDEAPPSRPVPAWQCKGCDLDDVLQPLREEPRDESQT